MKKWRVFIAGGGTGGHVYPALAIAKALLELQSEAEIHFVGTARGMETKAVPKHGFRLHLISMGRFNGVSRKEQLQTLFKLPLAFYESYKLLAKYKPQVVLGVGGYASLPVVLLAALMGKKAFIWEPNAYPGLANRWLSPFVHRALVVFEESKKYLSSKKVVVVGLPVRAEIENLPVLNKDRSTFNVLVFGGSLGARGINRVVCETVTQGGDWLEGVRIVHQTGRLDFEGIQKDYKYLTAPIEAHEFLHDMDQRYAWADLVICRAGASTVAELSAAGKASLLVPFPGATDEHQKKNAENLFNHKAALMCLQEDFTPEYLTQIIEKLKSDPHTLQNLSQNIKKLHTPHAAKDIAQRMLSSS